MELRLSQHESDDWWDCMDWPTSDKRHGASRRKIRREAAYIAENEGQKVEIISITGAVLDIVEP